VVAQVRSGLGHAAGVARWADATALAGESDKVVVATVVAPDAGKAVGKDAAYFRTPTNQRVQHRLSILARICDAGGFESKSSALFEHLAEAVLLEVPHDRRSLAEQVKLAEQDYTAD
jgi:hypothetical protein